MPTEADVSPGLQLARLEQRGRRMRGDHRRGGFQHRRARGASPSGTFTSRGLQQVASASSLSDSSIVGGMGKRARTFCGRSNFQVGWWQESNHLFSFPIDEPIFFSSDFSKTFTRRYGNEELMEEAVWFFVPLYDYDWKGLHTAAVTITRQ